MTDDNLGPIPPPEGGRPGPIRAAVQRLKEARQAKEDLKGKQMLPEQQATTGKDKDLTSFVHADWVKIYNGLLEHTLNQAADRVTQLSSGGQLPAHYSLKHRLFTDRLNAHPSGAVAVVGVEIHIRENGVSRSLMKKTRFFRTMLEYQQGKDQGLMECLQEVFADLATFAITAEVAMRYENKQNPKPNKDAM